jgi:hypothetical protein
MRKLSVPYTIRRNGVYYLNIRVNNQFVRQTLATKDPMEAFQKVNQIAPLLSNADVCEQMLRLQMSDIVGKSSRSRACGLKLAQSDDSLLLLSQGFALYKKEQIIENWGIRTAAQNESTFKQLLELIGDLPIIAVTKAVVREYRQALLNYPANRYKGNRKDKSIAQLNEEGCQTISLETVRNIIGRVSSFFNWLVKQGYKNENPFLGVAPRRVHSARSERSSFADHDLWLLFGTTIYISKLYKHEWQYWLPRLVFKIELKLGRLAEARSCRQILALCSMNSISQTMMR